MGRTSLRSNREMRSWKHVRKRLLSTAHRYLTVAPCLLFLCTLHRPFKCLCIRSSVPERLSLVLINPAHLLLWLFILHDDVEISFCWSQVATIEAQAKRIGLTTTEKKTCCLSLYTPGWRFQIPIKTLQWWSMLP